MSIKLLLMLLSKFIASKCDGEVEGFNEIPKTLAPKMSSHEQSHEPLKPECPVTKTFLF